jgi:hypothetical protein
MINAYYYPYDQNEKKSERVGELNVTTHCMLMFLNNGLGLKL